jgi:peroxiredoxin
MSGPATTSARTRGRVGRTVALVAIAALIVGLFAIQLIGGGTLPEGSAAPAFSLPRAGGEGDRVDLERLRGKVVVLDFWSTTCAPCRSQMGVLDALQRRMGPRGVQVVGVCAGGETVDEVAAFIREHGAPYPVAVDEDGAVTSAYRVRSLPTLYVLDGKGRVAASHVGFWPEGELAAAVAGALGER